MDADERGIPIPLSFGNITSLKNGGSGPLGPEPFIFIERHETSPVFCWKNDQVFGTQTLNA